MKITIRLRYYTRLGQNLFLCGDHERFGGGSPGDALPLNYVNEQFWEVSLDVPDQELPKDPVSYYFILRNQDGSVVEDFGGDRKLDFARLGRGHVVIIDAWNDFGAVENVYFTEPFARVLSRGGREPRPASPNDGGTHQFNVKAPMLPAHQTVCLLGSAGALGQWNQASPVLLRRATRHGSFSVQLVLTWENYPVEYKYGIYDTERNAFVRYEDGLNRILTQPALSDGQVVLNDGFARWPGPAWRGAGVAIPVFSLRSEKSFGVGEFADLPLLANWAHRAGLKLIQILPVNDTSATHSWTDSYPYSAISVFALHPLYLNLEKMAGGEGRALLKGLPPLRDKLNALDKVDYEAVMKAKLEFARNIFAAQGRKTFASPEYKRFCAENKHWLEPYAAFCYLRDKFGAADFNQWPEQRQYNAKSIGALAAQDATARAELDLHCFIQFHLQLQLKQATEIVHAQGLILKGDVAIGVSPHSADVWQHPSLFHTDMQAGAPPDAFAAKGQNWGFPTYNWQEMKEDGYAWWRQRLSHMSLYFDAFRIDHILGFFRIWSIPRDAVEGILGYFAPALPVSEGEFASRGIAFDRERLARPFINDAILLDTFGPNAERVKQEFLEPSTRGAYLLKAEFRTQRAVENYFAGRDSAKYDSKLKEGLFDLISNVLLIETGDGALHFRLGMDQTSSFRHLPPQTQARLKEFYIDYFYRRQEEGWRREAMEKLPALKRATNMLICGEDLGMVPACVPDVMKQLGLLSLEIQRMPKRLNQVFSRPADAPHLSVVTPGTHDMSTLRGWWLEDRAVIQKFFSEELRQHGPAPFDCEPWINREIVRQHLASPALWSIFQLQDLLGMDERLRRPDVAAERINVPAIVNYYWRYRMHLSLEGLAAQKAFTEQVETMVRQSGR